MATATKKRATAKTSRKVVFKKTTRKPVAKKRASPKPASRSAKKPATRRVPARKPAASPKKARMAKRRVVVRVTSYKHELQVRKGAAWVKMLGGDSKVQLNQLKTLYQQSHPGKSFRVV